ncbi:MAG: transglycosylase SLT domain-containing protein, partial [Phocaeicola sp.]
VYYTEVVGIDPDVEKGDKVKANEELGEVTNGVLKFALSKSLDSEYIAPSAILGNLDIDNTAKETIEEAKETAQVVLEKLDKEPTATSQPTKAEVDVIEDLDYGDLILEKSEKYDVDPTLVAGLIKQECGFNTKARSHAGAMGLMQLMPATAEWLGVEDAYDPDENVDAGVKYLKSLLKKYEDPELALYAYNGGPGNVDKWIKAGTIDNVPFKETREYAPKVLGNTETFKEEADVIAADNAAQQAAEASKTEEKKEPTHTPSLKNESDEKDVAMVENLPYGDIIIEAAEEENVDPVVVAGMIQTESAFNAEAVAPTDGDKGLMQLSEDDIKKYDVEDPFDAEENIKAGVKKFKKLLDKYNDVEKALYAYNGGEAALDQWEAAGLTADKFPWKETREYAQKVLVSFDEYKEEAKNTVVSPTDFDELPLPIKPGEFRISSDFDFRTHPVTGEVGSFHNGIDLAAVEGTEYYAIAKSKVTHSNASKTAGWIIRTEILEGPLKGYFVDYMHSYAKDVFVKIGDILEPGDLIGLVGNNGQSAGAHLHIGLASGYGDNGKPVYVDLADYSYELQASIGDFTNAKGNKVSKEETKNRI